MRDESGDPPLPRSGALVSHGGQLWDSGTRPFDGCVVQAIQRARPIMSDCRLRSG